jgi:hypothetical protein
MLLSAAWLAKRDGNWVCTTNGVSPDRVDEAEATRLLAEAHLDAGRFRQPLGLARTAVDLTRDIGGVGCSSYHTCVA